MVFSVYIPNKHLSKQCARHHSAQKDTKMKVRWPLPWGPAQGVGWIQTGKWIAGKPGEECCDGGKQSVCSMGQSRVHLMWHRLTPEACPSGLAEAHLHYEDFTSQIRVFSHPTVPTVPPTLAFKYFVSFMFIFFLLNQNQMRSKLNEMILIKYLTPSWCATKASFLLFLPSLREVSMS